MDTFPIRTEAGSTTSTTSPEIRTHARARFPKWVANITAGNPFYLISAALLLYGIYRVAVDPRFMETDSGQVIFNFSALQVYEAFLALTAVMLSRRRIWCDAALLVKVEALLVMAPFILVSHAVFLGESLGKVLCLTGATAAALRLALLKSGLPNLRLPGAYLAAGFLILSLNAVLPLVFRAGLDANIEAWHTKHLLLWVVVLPALMALPNLFPRERESGATDLDRRWLPLTLYLYWMVGTGVHLVCLNYVDQVDYRKETALQPHLIAPALWALAWTLFFRLSPLARVAAPRVQHALFAIPTLAPMPALWHQDTLFFLPLAGLNAVIYFALYLKRRGQSCPLHLALFSFVAAIAAFPLGSTWGILNSMERGDWIAAGLVLFVLLEGCLIRTPKFGLVGGALLVLSLAKLGDDSGYAWQLAVQAALIWVLLHSLCWNDRSEPHALVVRRLAGGVWTLHSWFWIQQGAGANVVPWLALAALGAYGVMRYFGGLPVRVIVPLAAAASIAPIPLQSAAIQVKETPAGIIALILSFLLFGLGTGFALWRSSTRGDSVFSTPESQSRQS